jgi:3-keto steroid reductase
MGKHVASYSNQKGSSNLGPFSQNQNAFDLLQRADRERLKLTDDRRGLGYDICVRIITQFLTTRAQTQSLLLIPTTRSQQKADDTVARLQGHITALSNSTGPIPIFSRTPETRDSTTATPSKEARQLFSSRVAIQPQLLDLCSLRSVHDAASGLKKRYKRLDVVICNAGIGGWTGIDWFGLIKQFLTQGVTSMTTVPGYKLGTLGAVTGPQITQKLVEGDVKAGGDGPKLGEVFTANVFGHYMLVHGIATLLRRPSVADESERARIIWVSTVEAVGKKFDLEDIQGMKTTASYESSKRLTDVLALSSRKQDTKEFVESLLDGPQTVAEDTPRKSGRTTRSSTKSTLASSATVGPDMYLSHPGICATTIMPLHWSLVWLMKVTFLVVRWLGSKWHTVSTELGATAMTWLALEDQAVLERERALNIKWGSGVSRWGQEAVIETPVDSFDNIDKETWRQMEELRAVWKVKLNDSC